MVDQTSQFYAILTNVGLAKQANADALGVPWTFAQMAIGDGNPTGLDNPPLPMPVATQTALLNEWRRAPLNQLKVDPNNAAVIIAEQIIPDDVGGKWIRELALYDAAGDMVAVANCPPTFKPLLNQNSGRTQVVRLNLIVSNTSNVQLKIDPSVVLATREWVTEELAKQDFKHSVVAATTAAITLSGLQTVDGVVLTAGARVLVKNQAAAKDNGLYLVVAGGAWTRCTDADASAKVTPGMLVLVERGTVNGDSAWQLVTDAPITLGVTALAYEMAFGRTGVAAGTYRSVTVDAYGRVTAATNPTTVAGYGLTDVYTQTQVNNLLAAKAPLASPGFTGTPTAPTAPVGTNSAQLANTAFVQAAINALIAASPGALDTLNELAAALGNDPNFAATVTNALALKAPLLSPLFTGAPKGPTPALFDKSKNLATTEFVQQAIGGFSGYYGYPTSGQTIPPAHINGIINLNSEATSVTLPLASSVPLGSVLYIRSSRDAIINRQGTDTIYVNSSNTLALSVAVGVDSNITLLALSTGWFIAGNASLAHDKSLFGFLKGSNGYQKLPSGIMIQWCNGQIAAGQSSARITLPEAFPTSLVAYSLDTANAGHWVTGQNASPSGMDIIPRTVSGGNIIIPTGVVGYTSIFVGY